jgi:hypothetical protein
MSGYFLLLLIIPLYIYQTLDPHGKTVMLVGTAVILGLCLLVYLGRVALRAAAIQRHPVFILSRWERGASASDFRFGFANHVKSLGCQVLWSRVLDPRKVAMTVEKQRTKIFMLCLDNVEKLSELELKNFGRWRSEHEPDRSFIVLPAPSLAPNRDVITTPFELLTYEDLAQRCPF